MKSVNICLCANNWGDLLEQLRGKLPDFSIAVLDEENIVKHPEIKVLIPGIMKVTDDIISRLPNLVMIHQAGVGVDSVDLKAAKQRGIWVANVPSYSSGNAESVAEIAIHHMLSLSRRVPEAQGTMGNGGWGNPLGASLRGKTVGIYGAGGIGKALAERLVSFGVRLIGIKRNPERKRENMYPFERLEGLEFRKELLKIADFVIITASANRLDELQPFTRDDFEAMKPSAYFINVSRGVWVNEDDLFDALKNKRIAGAGLDVLREEPPRSPERWLNSGLNLFVTPHIGGCTHESYDGITQYIQKNIELVFRGLPPVHSLN